MYLKHNLREDMKNLFEKINIEEMHPLSKYLIEKIHTWDKHFGPISVEDCESAISDINIFLLNFKKIRNKGD